MAIDIETSLSPSSQRIVSDWVRGLTSDSLDSRAELVRDVEVSHINSIPPSMSAIQVAKPAREVDSLESSFVRGGADPPRAPKWVGWASLVVGLLLATVGIVALLVRRAPSAPLPPSANAPQVETPSPLSVGATGPTPAETAGPAPSPQDSAATVARSPEVPNSTRAANRRAPVRAQRPGPTQAPSSGDAKPFLPNEL